MNEEPNKGGRPAHFDSPEVLEEKVNAYFDWIRGESKKNDAGEDVWVRMPEPGTITGLTLWLGFESRQSFYDYEERDGFSYAIKKARTRIEHEYEKKLGCQSPTGAIFALKNMGWKDKQEIESNNTHAITWEEHKTYAPQPEANTGA